MRFLFVPGLVLTASCLAAPSLTIDETDEAITVSRGDQPIVRYNKALQTGPEGTDSIYHRSGYLHPVFTPTGQVVTGDFSEDHAHQRGIFMAGTNTLFRGERVDFWNLHRKLGRTEHAKTLSTGTSNDSVSFTVVNRHVATINDAETTVLNEIWTLTARETSNDYILFDIESRQSLATPDPLIYQEYHYGGMALRGSNLWTPLESNPDGTCVFLTSSGDNRQDGNHTHVRWVAMSGVIDGEDATIVTLCHPDNFRFPQAVRIHPRMPYFTFAPMFDGEFSIQPGEAYTSRYRYLVTSKKPDPKWIESQWEAYRD